MKAIVVARFDGGSEIEGGGEWRPVAFQNTTVRPIARNARATL
jgi:hypothetical protein